MYPATGIQDQDWLFMLLMMTIMTVVTIIAVVAVVRAVRAVRGRNGPSDSALRLLDGSYARGEITAEERRQRREQLLQR